MTAREEIAYVKRGEPRRQWLRRSMDIIKVEHMEYVRQKMPKAVPHMLACLEDGKTMVNTGAHSGYRIDIDRRDGGERRKDG